MYTRSKRRYADDAEANASQGRRSQDKSAGREPDLDTVSPPKVRTLATDEEQPSTSGLSAQKEEAEQSRPHSGECLICGEDGYILYPSVGEVVQVPGEGYVAPVCSNVEHLSCVECMTGHLRQQIADGRLSVPCPATDCDYQLSAADRARFGGLMESLGDQALEANQQKELSRGLTPCPGEYQGKECPAKYDIGAEMVDKAFPYKCQTCTTSFCLGCLAVPPHPAGMNCKAMRERNIYELTDIGHPVTMKIALSKDFADTGALCRCGVVIQRTAGCIHMMHNADRRPREYLQRLRGRDRGAQRDVTACNAEFCYVCRSSWDQVCDHNRCKRDPVSCISCKARAVRFQVGTEHYICQGTPAHEFCRSCDGVWDGGHEKQLECPVARQSGASTSMASFS